MSKKTLADMTPEERDQCNGMWCDFDYLDDQECLAIFAGMSKRQTDYANVIYDGECGMVTLPETLTPRFDLPRAWNPDGTPVVADPEEYTVEAAGFVQLADGGGMQRTPFPPGTKVRRWVSDWEAVE